MKKIASLAMLGGATLALAACGSSESASTEATADTVEVAPDEALESITDEPTDDTAANEGPPEGEDGPPPAPVSQEAAETAAEGAAEVAERAEAAAQAAEAADAAAAAAAAADAVDSSDEE